MKRRRHLKKGKSVLPMGKRPKEGSEARKAAHIQRIEDTVQHTLKPLTPEEFHAQRRAQEDADRARIKALNEEHLKELQQERIRQANARKSQPQQ